MKASLEKAFGYQGDNMNLPVADVAAAVPFYERIMGFRVVERSDGPQPSVTLARDNVRMRLVENGGDPAQDGCAFHVTGVDALWTEFKANGLDKPGLIGTEQRGGAEWRVFFVVAPDGLCYWLGERQGESS